MMKREKRNASRMPSRSLSFDEGDARVSKIKRTAVTTYRRFTGQVLGGEGGGGTASFVEGTQDDAVSNGTALSRSQTIVRDAEGTERVTEIVVEDTDWDKLQGAIYDPAHLDERAIDADSDSDGRLSRTGLSSEGWPNTLRLTGDALKRFIWPTFPNPQHEALFRKESYLAKKGAAMGMSLYFCLNWVLYLGINFGQHTFDTGTLFSKICYYGIATFFTLPLPVLIAYDVPTRSYFWFQLYLLGSSWVFGYIEVIQTRLCGFWVDHRNCDQKDFLAMTFYLSAIPALSLFVLQARIFTCIGAAISCILMLIFDLPHAPLFSRVFINLLLFYVFIISGHFVGERRERRLFRINVQLKNAYRAQQKAQVKESEAFASKRRFISYIFHEVRVPLNTAFIAYQNLHANRAFKETADDDNEVEIDALEGSLSMMSKVLDDVLDIQRMDAGRFENCSLPFELHKSVQMTLASVKAAAIAKNISLQIDIDDRIDKLTQTGRQHLWLIGDSTRLRQVLSNLASNAVKFTPDGGKISIATELLRHIRPKQGSQDSEKTLAVEDTEKATEASDNRSRIVVRFSVTDNGPGIDFSSGSTTLFLPFSQTHIGKSMGSKGSGLGLAIVRQIVKLSGGRVGVASDPATKPGTTFWFELAFWLASTEEIEAAESQKIRAKTITIPSNDNARPNDNAAFRPDPNRQSSFDSSALHGSGSGSQLPTPVAEEAEDINPKFPFDTAIPIVPRRALTRTQSSPTVPQQHQLAQRSPSKLALPPIVQASPLPGPAVTRRVTVAKERWQVLTADDDTLTRKLMTRLLQRLGCEVTTAEDGQAALDLLLGTENTPPRRFDCVFLDNQMPFRSGPGVASALRAAGRDDFIVGVTGNALRDDQDEYLAAGADHILTKPVMQIDLKRMLKMATAHASSRSDTPPKAASPVPSPGVCSHDGAESLHPVASNKRDSIS